MLINFKEMLCKHHYMEIVPRVQGLKFIARVRILLGFVSEQTSDARKILQSLIRRDDYAVPFCRHP